MTHKDPGRRMNIKSHLTDINDGMIHLVTDNIKPYISNYKRMNIYNKNLKFPFHKIWLKTPKMKVSNVFVSEKNKQVGLLHVSLYSTDEDTEKLQNYLVQLEEYVGTIIDSENELVCKSNINYLYGAFPTLTFQLPIEKIEEKNIKLSCHIYDENNEKVNYHQVTNEHLVEAYIEVSDIWIRPGEYGINLKVLQMQTSTDFNFDVCLFQDEDSVFMERCTPPPPNLTLANQIQPSQSHQYTFNQINKNNLKAQESMSFAPNANQLIEMRKNLRPTPSLLTESSLKLKSVRKIKGDKSPHHPPNLSPTISDENLISKPKKKKIVKKIKTKSTSISEDSISSINTSNTFEDSVESDTTCNTSVNQVENSFDDSIDDDIDFNIGSNTHYNKESIFTKTSPHPPKNSSKNNSIDESNEEIKEKPKKVLKKKKKKIVKKKSTILVEN